MRSVLIRPTFILSGLLLISLLNAPLSASAADARPNIILILADDLGWADTTLYGKTSLYETPNIERLAARGMTFTDAYAASPICSPTRASIMSGQNPARHGMTQPAGHTPEIRFVAAANKNGRPHHKSTNVQSATRLDPSIPTLAQVLKDAGYSTAHFGKWHLGTEPHSPLQLGFDVDIPHWHGPGPKTGYLAPWKYSNPDFKEGKPGEHIEDRMAKEAVAWLKGRDRTKPFFMNYWQFSVHAPFGAKPELIERYRNKIERGAAQQSPTYAAMVHSLDDAVGSLLDALDAEGIADETVIVFYSDNGGNIHCGLNETDAAGKEYVTAITSNHPLRGGKGGIHEGGIRVPAVVVWPGVTNPGSRSDVRVQSTDLYPTILRMLNVERPKDHVIDGVDFAKALRGEAMDRGPMFTFVPWHGKTPQWLPPSMAVHHGDWKLIRTFHYGENGNHEYRLYNLRDDIGENNNLAADLPEKVKALDGLIEEYVAEAEVVVPLPNPNFDPAKFDPAMIGVQAGGLKMPRAKKGLGKAAPAKPKSKATPNPKPQATSKSKPKTKSVAKNASDRPNFVFIFADDLGYGDLACYGHPYAKTPTLDQLAKEGTRYTQAYAAGPTCNPSRTGIMTGRCVARFEKRTDDFDFGDRVTVTELLKKNGYATGHFGKWHIGMDRSNGVYGIDENDSGGKPDIDSPQGRDAPIFDAAIDFIKRHKDKPFYVNIWGFTTHHPVASAPNFLEKFKDVKVDRKDFAGYMQPVFDDSNELGGDVDLAMRHYLGNVYAFDQNVKSVLDVLDKLGLNENTIVVFSSDQGPPRPYGIGDIATGPKAKAKVRKTRDGRIKRASPYYQNMLGDTGVFRGNKGTLREGGLRIPFIIRWPGHVKAGVVDNENVIAGYDWLPSICSLAGVKDVPNDLDGEDVSDIWLGATRKRKEPLLWGGRTWSGIRDGKWKYYLLMNRKNKIAGEELYDILEDPGEKKNLAKKYPEVAAELKKKVLAFKSELPEQVESTGKYKHQY